MLGTRRVRNASWQIMRIGVGASRVQRLAEYEVLPIFKQIGLIVRPAPIDIVEIEPGCAIIDESIGIVLLLKRTRRVECQVVIDELAEICIDCRYAAFFRIGAVLGILMNREHFGGKHLECGFALNIVRTEIGRWQGPEHPAERSAKQK